MLTDTFLFCATWYVNYVNSYETIKFISSYLSGYFITVNSHPKKILIYGLQEGFPDSNIYLILYQLLDIVLSFLLLNFLWAD